MLLVHPAEVLAMRQRIDALEIELQRTREIVSQKADNEAWLKARIRELESQLVALWG